MAAPSSAYNNLDMTLLTVAHRVAKMTGRHNTLANAKANFHLDKVFAKRDDTTGALIGFIGAVIENGTNAAWRSSARLSRTRVIDDVSGTRYRLLLDAGLNLKPEVNIIVLSRYANWVVFQLSIKVPPYNAVSSSSATMSYFGQTVSLGGSSSVSTTITKTATFTHSTPATQSEANSSKYQKNYSYACSGTATNDEGSDTGSTSFVSLDRVVYPRRHAQMSTSEPGTVNDLSGDNAYDLKEADWFKLKSAAEGTISGLGVYMYRAPNSYPTLSSKWTGRWFHDSGLDTTAITKAFYVNSSGLVEKMKNLRPQEPGTFSLYVYVCNDRYASSSYPCYAISYELYRINMEWVQYDAFRVTVKGNSSSSVAAQKLGLELSRSSSFSSVSYQTNLTASDMTVTLTTGESLNDSTRVIRGIYRKSSYMYSDPSGYSDKYLDAGTCQYSRAMASACTCQVRRRSDGAWIAMPAGFKFQCIVCAFDLNRTP